LRGSFTVEEIGEKVLDLEIARGEERVYDEQAETLVDIFARQDKLSEDELSKLRHSFLYFKMSVLACTGWGDEELLKSVKQLVETLNEYHNNADKQLITESVAPSVSNFICNCLDGGEYSLDDDPTVHWKQW
jgi:dihydroorotase